MEKQHISILRMKNKLGMTALCIVLCLLLSPVLLVALCVPQCMGLFPVVLLAMLGFVGPVSALGCCAVLTGAAGMLLGGWGAAAAALFLVPALLAAGFMAERRQSFWASAAGVGVTQFAALSVVMALLGAVAGTDVVSAITEMVRQTFSSASAFNDSLLMTLVQTGVLQLENGIPQISQITGLLTDAARETLVEQMTTLMDLSLRLEMPAQMATGAVAAGVLGQAALCKGLRRRGVDVPYEPMRTWRIPKGWGGVLAVTMLALYVMAMLLPGAMSSMTYVFSGVLQQVLALQGIAAIFYILHQRGAKKIWRAAAFAAGYFFLQAPASMIGVADQVMDFTHRREHLDKETTPSDQEGQGRF